MVDLDLLRADPEQFRTALKSRFMPTGLVDEVLLADQQWRLATAKSEALRAERNVLAKSAETARQHHSRLKEIKKTLDRLEEQEVELSAARAKLLASLPNLLASDVPIGEGESANKSIKKIGKISRKEGQSHEELMTKLGWLDLTTAAKASGARFRYLKNDAAIAWMKLSHLAFDFAVEKGFTPVVPPTFVKEEILSGSGFFPEGKDTTFKVEDAYLSGTSEPLLLALGMNQVLSEKDLPLRFVGFSTCFRREAGSYGKDTRGMFRQHQFDKVEMVSICHPEDSAKEHEFLLKLEEEFISQFDLPYQVVLIGSGDLGFPAAKKYDIEAWFPSQARYRETHSVSNCTDYQARGLSIKYRQNSGEVAYVHTLNGTLATERLLLAIVENGQTDDSTVELPRQLK